MNIETEIAENVIVTLHPTHVSGMDSWYNYPEIKIVAAQVCRFETEIEEGEYFYLRIYFLQGSVHLFYEKQDDMLADEAILIEGIKMQKFYKK